MSSCRTVALRDRPEICQQKNFRRATDLQLRYEEHELHSLKYNNIFNLFSQVRVWYIVNANKDCTSYLNELSLVEELFILTINNVVGH